MNGHIEQPPIAPLGWGGKAWLRRARAVVRMVRVLFHVVHVSATMPRAFANASDAEKDALIRHWSQGVLHCMGVQSIQHGHITTSNALVVSNHVSWMDIMAINAVHCCRFVSKKEVADWPVVGSVVTLANTMYVDRSKRRDATRVLQEMSTNLQAGHSVVVFPEGTTGTGPQLLHFHANLLQAAIDAKAPIQPIVVRYQDASHVFSPCPVYVGDTNLLQSLWWIACADQLIVHLQLLPVLQTTDHDRRTLCAQLHHQMGQVLTQPTDKCDQPLSTSPLNA